MATRKFCWIIYIWKHSQAFAQWADEIDGEIRRRAASGALFITQQRMSGFDNLFNLLEVQRFKESEKKFKFNQLALCVCQQNNSIVSERKGQIVIQCSQIPFDVLRCVAVAFRSRATMEIYIGV